ncbi:MAG: sodium:solute symporter family protein [Clostridiales bacterium]|nr:sodium:solute symporter family protein [Clostridiales bacterium]
MDNLSVWITIAVYIAALVVIGIVTGKKSKSVADFTVGGRKAGAWLSALSYGTAYFSAVMFVGYAGKTGLSFGLWGILAGIGNAVFGSLLAWIVLARKTRDVSARLKIQTMPQFFEARYGSVGMRTFSAAVIFVFLIPYSASVYSGLASIAKNLLGIDDAVFLIIIAVLAMLIILFGGYLVQARADFVQGLVMMVGVTLLIVCVVRSRQVGGLQGIMEYAKTDAGLPKLNGIQWVGLMATVLMTSFGTWGLPQMISKYFGIKDDRQAKRGIIISTFFAFLVAGGGYFIGSLCHRFYTVGKDMPAADDIVPLMLKDSALPAILLGVIIVLLLSASVSTLCSVTLSASSALSIDIVGNRIKKDMPEKKKGVLTKVFCVLFIILSYVVANTKTPILDMMSYSWGIISGSFLAPYLLALYYKKLNKISAWAGILTGFSIALVPATCKVLNLCGNENETVLKLMSQGPLYACIAMIASILVCFVFSVFTQKLTDKKVNDFFYNGTVEAE